MNRNMCTYKEGRNSLEKYIANDVTISWIETNTFYRMNMGLPWLIFHLAVSMCRLVEISYFKNCETEFNQLMT